MLVFEQAENRGFVLARQIPGFNTLSVRVADVNADVSPDIIIASNNGVTAVRVLYNAPQTCDADLNTDGVLNFFDLSTYLAWYSDADPSADLAAPFGELNFFDLAAYLNLFGAGCP